MLNAKNVKRIVLDTTKPEEGLGPPTDGSEDRGSTTDFSDPKTNGTTVLRECLLRLARTASELGRVDLG
jgi:hypothetical protein